MNKSTCFLAFISLHICTIKELCWAVSDIKKNTIARREYFHDCNLAFQYYFQIKYKFHGQVGDPGVHICTIAKDEKATMIVLGTRGLGTIRRTIMGSVSDYVLHHAHIPVLIYRH